MNCQQIRELLSPYQDGMLDEEQKLYVEKHLQGCSQCRQELEELQFVIELMQQSVEVCAPQGFSQLVLERVNTGVIPEKSAVWRGGLVERLTEKWKALRPKYGQGAKWSWVRISAVAAMLVLAIGISMQLRTSNFLLTGESPIAQSIDGIQSMEQSTALKAADTDAGQESAMPGISEQERAMPRTPEQGRVEMYALKDNASTGSERAVNEENLGSQKPAPKTKAAGAQAATAQTTAENSSTAQAVKAQSAAERKVIKRGRVEMQVTNVEKTYAQLIQKVNAVGGYIESSAFNKSPDGTPKTEQYHTGNLVIRIPVGKFESFFAGIKSEGTVIAQELNGQDVSAEFYDTEARIRNSKQQETRLLEILKQAKNVEEILKVESELQRVRQEVEVMEGQIHSLSNLSEMATLELFLTQVKKNDAITLPEKNILQQTGEAFIESINTLLEVLGDLVVLVGGLAPVLFILLVLGGGFIHYRRWKVRKNKL